MAGRDQLDGLKAGVVDAIGHGEHHAGTHVLSPQARLPISQRSVDEFNFTHMLLAPEYFLAEAQRKCRLTVIPRCFLSPHSRVRMKLGAVNPPTLIQVDPSRRSFPVFSPASGYLHFRRDTPDPQSHPLETESVCRCRLHGIGPARLLSSRRRRPGNPRERSIWRA